MAKTKKTTLSPAAFLQQNSEFNVHLYEEDTVVTDPPDYISTGNYALDTFINPKNPGIPLSKIIEITGKPHAGKSTLALQIAREAQKKGGIVSIWDVEGSLNTQYMDALGIEKGSLVLPRPEYDKSWSVENVFQDVAKQIPAIHKNFPGTPYICIVDSLGQLKDQDSVDKDAEAIEKGKEAGKSSKPGAVAKAMANVMRIVPNKLVGTHISLIIINHTYQAIGPISYSKSYGGDALGYAKQLGLSLTATTALDPNDKGLGKNVKLKINKNKTANTSYKEIQLALVKDAGFDNYFTAFQVLSKTGVIQTTSNGRTTLTDEVKGEIKFTKKFKGLKEACLEDPELNERVMEKYRANVDVLVGK